MKQDNGPIELAPSTPTVAKTRYCLRQCDADGEWYMLPTGVLTLWERLEPKVSAEKISRKDQETWKASILIHRMEKSPSELTFADPSFDRITD